MKTLAEYLKDESLTQEQFASMLGVSQSSVSKWLSGNPPKLSTMHRISAVTNGAVRPEVWLQTPAEVA